MKVILAGSRTLTDLALLEAAILEAGLEITEVVCGEARGVDELGRAWALKHGIPVVSFPAQWLQDGIAAGYLRNVKMAEYAQALVAVWDGWSRGTAHMIATAASLGMPVCIYKVMASAPEAVSTQISASLPK